MLGGLDYHSIAAAVKRALAGAGLTFGSITTTGDVTVGGNEVVTGTLTATGGLTLGAQNLVDAAPTTWNALLGADATWTMAASRTLSNATNIPKGGYLILRVIQGGAGGWAITWGANYRGLNGAFQPPQPNPVAGTETDYFFYSPDGTIAQLVDSPILLFGQCYLSKSGANLLLARKDGTFLTINGKLEVIPDTGVTLGTGGLAASTAYYIYAFMNAGVMTLEASATTHATQAGTGVEIKSGDGTRTYIGMAKTTAGTAWIDDTTTVGVISYFNRRAKSIVNNFTASRTTTSTTYVELNSEIRGNVLTFPDEAVIATGQGVLKSNNTASYVAVSIGFDGTNQENGMVAAFTSAANSEYGFNVTVRKSGLSEGSHYATLLGNNSGGNTSTFMGGTFAANTTVLELCTVHVTVRG